METIKTLFAEIRTQYRRLNPFPPRLDAGYITLCYAKDILSWTQEREAHLSHLQKEVFGTQTEKINIAEATTKHLIKTEMLKKKMRQLKRFMTNLSCDYKHKIPQDKQKQKEVKEK